MLYRKFWGTLS